VYSFGEVGSGNFNEADLLIPSFSLFTLQLSVLLGLLSAATELLAVGVVLP